MTQQGTPPHQGLKFAAIFVLALVCVLIAAYVAVNGGAAAAMFFGFLAIFMLVVFVCAL